MNPASTGDAAPPAPGRTFRGAGRILAFVALATLVVTGIDALIDGGLRRIETGKYGSLNRIMTGRVNAGIVISGSSRAAFHYDPRAIREATGRPAYNLGLIGARIDLQLALLRTYLKHNARPQLVIQNLDTALFATTRTGEINDPALYAPYLYEDALYRPLLAADPAVWKWRHLPLYVYAVEDLRFVWARGLMGWLGRHGRETLFDGFHSTYEGWGADLDAFHTQLGGGVAYGIEPDAVAALAGIMELCRDTGIALVLVHSPEYHEAQALVRNRGEIFAEFRRLCARYDVPLWDYSDSPLSRNREYFYTYQHLNAGGAAAFSADLARRVAAHPAAAPSR